MVVENDAEIVVPKFKVGEDEKKKEKNSDMGSDCAYFSGPGEDDDDNEDDDQQYQEQNFQDNDDEFADF